MERERKKIDFTAFPHPTRLHSDDVKVPGLTPGAEAVDRLLNEAARTWTVFAYKVFSPCLWVIFLGGTGTGKSTLFNAFVGKPLSRTGVERPITAGPVVYAHQECPIEHRFPFEGMEATRIEAADPDLEPATGMPGHLLILEHHQTEWSHLVLVDTPDVDSVEAAHRHVAENLYHLSDAVVFITSQEKYADEVPYRFLSKVLHDHKLCYVVLNKAETRARKEDLIKTVQSEDTPIAAEKVWLIPYAPAQPWTWFSEHHAFKDLRLALLRDLSKGNLDDLHQAAISSLAHSLDQSMAGLLARIQQENEAAQQWSGKLEALTRQIIDDFLQAHSQRFAQRAREHLGVEVRRLFSRYDVLARPRRFIKELVLTPFRVLGLARNREPGSREEALRRARQNMDLTPLQEAVTKFNRLVLETLSPGENRPSL